MPPDALIVSGSGGKLAPGCEDTQTGRVITVPATDGRLQWHNEGRDGENNPTHEEGPTTQALVACLEHIKAHPEFSDEFKVILSADPEIEFEHLVGAMDAVRGPECPGRFNEAAQDRDGDGSPDDPTATNQQACSAGADQIVDDCLFPCVLLSAGVR